MRACVFDVESRPVPQLIKNEWRAKEREELSAVAGARLTLASLADALPLPPGTADYFRSPIPALPQPLPGFPSGSATAVGVFHQALFRAGVEILILQNNRRMFNGI